MSESPQVLDDTVELIGIFLFVGVVTKKLSALL